MRAPHNQQTTERDNNEREIAFLSHFRENAKLRRYLLTLADLLFLTNPTTSSNRSQHEPATALEYKALRQEAAGERREEERRSHE